MQEDKFEAHRRCKVEPFPSTLIYGVVLPTLETDYLQWNSAKLYPPSLLKVSHVSQHLNARF